MHRAETAPRTHNHGKHSIPARKPTLAAGRPSASHNPSPPAPSRRDPWYRVPRATAQLLGLLRPFRGSVLLLLGLSLGAVAIEVVPPMLQGYLVDHVLRPEIAKNSPSGIARCSWRRSWRACCWCAWRQRWSAFGRGAFPAASARA